MGLRAIGRVLKVSNVSVLRWIRSAGEHVKAYVNEHLPDDIQEIDIVEKDEMWHFNPEKKRKLWIWIAIEKRTQKVLGFAVGSRGKKALKNLLTQIGKYPVKKFATDSWRVY